RAEAREFEMLTLRGVPAFDLLAKKMGITTKEVRSLSEKGLLKGSAVADALIESFGEGKFANLGDRLSRTILGKESNLRDALSQQAGEAAKDTMVAYGNALDAAMKLSQSQGASKLGKAINAPVESGLQLGADLVSGATTAKDIGRALPRTIVE